MKFHYLPAVLLALCASKAHAQVQLKSDIPRLAEKTPAPLPDLATDPKLPPLPLASAPGPTRLSLTVLQTYRGPVYQLEAVNQTREAILKALVSALGATCLIDSNVRRSEITVIRRSATLEGLLMDMSHRGVVMWKSSTGAYIFSDSFQVTMAPSGLAIESVPTPPASAGRSIDPLFVVPRPAGTPKPQPWGKMPFNGSDVYIIPVPSL